MRVSAALAAIALAACTESQLPKVTGEASVRGMNAVVDSPDVMFRIEERSLGTLNYKAVTTTDSFDDLSYTFNFDASLPGDTELKRLASRPLAVVPDMDYLFVLAGNYADPEILLWETSERQWEGNEEVTEVAAGHLSTTLDGIDFYLVAPGAAPVVGDVRGTLEFGERLDNFDVESGDYQVVLTPPGDPATILFRSTAQTLPERTSLLFTIQDADPSITSTISVRRVGSGGGSTELGDRNTLPTRRYLHAAAETGSLDIFVDEDFSAATVAGLAFGTTTADISVPVGATTYTYTAAGNTGAVLLEDENTLAANSRTTSFIVGPASSDLDVVDLVDDRRPVVGTSKVRIIQLAENFDSVDIYLRPAGTDIGDINANFPQVSSPSNTAYSRLEPGDYEITVTEPGEKVPLAPVMSLDLAAGNIAEVAVLDTVDPAAVSLLRYD